MATTEKRVEELERELYRKELALAETAALLVLEELPEVERRILVVANREEFRDASPQRIVPRLADRGEGPGRGPETPGSGLGSGGLVDPVTTKKFYKGGVNLR